MKKMKSLVSLILVLALSCSLAASASATKWGDPINVKTKSTEYGTLTGKIWTYVGVMDNGRLEYEPTAETSISSNYTMVETTVDLECVYDDTGTAPSSTWSASNTERNQNTAEVGLWLSTDGRSVTAFSTHGITYTRSYALYMTTRL